jgi:hypothetical protein
MNKKYTIINSNSQNDGTTFCIDYIFYIVIFILLIYIASLVIPNKYKDNFSNIYEKFGGVNSSNINQSAKSSLNTNNKPTEIVKQSEERKNTKSESESESESRKKMNMVSTNSIVEQRPTIEQLYQQLKSKNTILSDSNSHLEKSLKEKERAIYLSKFYNKIDEKSFNNEVDFINTNFATTILPTAELTGKKIISNQNELSNVLNEVKTFKNMYNVGDIVTQNSDFNITADNICYADHMDKLAADPEFKKKYPNCMVCSVNPESNYKFTNSYKNTKTNINKVCLFNPNASANSDEFNYDGCAKVCSVNQ